MARATTPAFLWCGEMAVPQSEKKPTPSSFSG